MFLYSVNFGLNRGKESKDEWIVLLYYFVNCPEATQTNSHEALQEFARVFGRTPGSMDASMRNIKSYVKGPGFAHGSKTMRFVVDEYFKHPSKLKNAARSSMARINPKVNLP